MADLIPIQLGLVESEPEPIPPISIEESGNPAVDALVGRLLGFLTPENPIEEVLILQTVLGARFLTELAQKNQLDDPKWCTKQRLAMSMFHKNLGTLERRRKPSKVEKNSAKARPTRDELLALERNAFEPPEQTPEEIAEAAREWREAVAVVPEITCEFPLLLKTRRVVEWYLSLASDGLTDRQILRLDPRINYADLAAMKACEAAKLNGPFDTFCQIPSNVPVRPLAGCPTYIPPPPPDPRRAARAAALGTKPVPGWE